jgi:hypothetical protein
LANSIVETQLLDAVKYLTITVQSMEDYLNKTTLQMLVNGTESDADYYKRVISQCRKILVYSEGNLEEANLLLKASPLPKQLAEKILFKIYHQCIEEFFSPKSDVWYEDSRAAYTGKNAICFRMEVPTSLERLFQQIEGGFQHLREELEYYETDYKTKLLQSK